MQHHNFNSLKTWQAYPGLLKQLTDLNISYDEIKDTTPAESRLHIKDADIPELVIHPENESQVAAILALLEKQKLYEKFSVAVKSGGHSYLGDSSCKNIMINLSRLNQYKMENNGGLLVIEPGVNLGKVVMFLYKNKRVVPHGDCITVCAGGHWLTAGWDLLLTRIYGLGCQSIKSGRIVLWDGKTIEVTERNYPDILFALRGGAAANIGIVTQLSMQTYPQPEAITFLNTPLTANQVSAFTQPGMLKAIYQLPKEIAISFKVYFPDKEPSCLLRLFTTLDKTQCLDMLSERLPSDVVRIISSFKDWQQGNMLDVRTLPNTEYLKNNTHLLEEFDSVAIHKNEHLIWKQANLDNEMSYAFIEQRSVWISLTGDRLIADVVEVLKEVKPEFRKGIYILFTTGSDELLARQNQCSMKLGHMLIRCEVHWQEDTPDNRRYGKQVADRLHEVFVKHQDKSCLQPYRGDAWLKSQIDLHRKSNTDACVLKLAEINTKYSSANPQVFGRA